MSADSVLQIETRETEHGPIEIWTMNRPKVLNALNGQLLTAIDEAGRKLADKLSHDLMSCRALILTGAGERAFVAGADISEMQNFGRQDAERFSRLGQQGFGRLEHLPIPTIAAIRGFALGGGLELAMGCDVLIATPDSEFGQPEAFLGLLPGFGATARFADRLGVNKALELLYTGRRIKAEEALALGLIQKIAAPDRAVLDVALDLGAEMIRKSGPLALAAVKRVVRTQKNPDFDEICEAEAKAFGEIFESMDKKEGVTAFLEKRPAKFTGR